MTIIDQRILIPASAQVVWEHISDINNNPRWQADCRSISMLTSMRAGPGVRWRTSEASGREFVVEITRWYDGLGYEYRYVDGMPFSEGRGRIRLQEIAEGTIVQWTIEYQLTGVLGGLRNSLSTRRQIEAAMTTSLRQLWRYIQDAGGRQEFHESKALMKESLDYEQRSRYRPRHRSVFAERVETEPPPLISEPPADEDDTRPNPAVAAAPARSPEIPAGPPVPEPEFLANLPPVQGLKEFQRPIDLPASAAPPPVEERPEQAPAESQDVIFPEPLAPPPPAAAPETEPFKAPAASESNQESTAQQLIEPPKPSDTSKLDTAQISIWEVFGVPRPSETREIPQVTLSPTPPPTPEVEAEPPSAQPAQPAEPHLQTDTATPLPEAPASLPLMNAAPPVHVGLRLTLRQNSVKLRRK